MLLQLQMKIKCSPEVRILRRQNSQTLWSLAKRHLKQAVRLVVDFLYGNSGDSNRIFSDVFFAYMLQCKRSSTSLVTIVWLNSIRFIASLLYGLKDVIASENCVFEVRILDVAVLCENTHLRLRSHLVPQHGAWEIFLMGTNVNTPVIQVPRPEFGH